MDAVYRPTRFQVVESNYDARFLHAVPGRVFMRTKSTNRIVGILLPAILMLASSCVKLEIIGTRSGDEFVAGERILFQARTE
jgi:hypothetical protein